LISATVSVLFCTAPERSPRYASFMAMLIARASLPAWVVLLAIGAFLAPAGIATTVLLVALGSACLPAVITGGVWKRTRGRKVSGYREAAAVTAGETPAIDDREPAAIDAEYTSEDVTPTGLIRR
jgi:hypothetical protein